MSRKSKSSRKKTQKNRQSRSKTNRQRLAPQADRNAVAKAERLIEQHRYSDAKELLEAHVQRKPQDQIARRWLLEVYHGLREYGSFCDLCEDLLRSNRDDAELHLMLAAGSMADARPASTLLAFQEFVRRWPHHPMAEGARQTIAEIEPDVLEAVGELGLPEHNSLELAASHERILSATQQNDYPRAIRLAKAFLKRHPDFAPVLNNVSEAYFRNGQLDEAVECAQRVLAADENNLHALANLPRYLFLSGRFDEAEVQARHLKSLESSAPDIWGKRAEALAYLGDDQAVLEQLEGAKRHRQLEASPQTVLLYHLTAVASARQDRWPEAKRLWRRALRINPDFDLARDNLEDAQLPVGERHGPWSYGIDYWIHWSDIEQLQAELATTADKELEEQFVRKACRFVERKPYLAKLIPHLLDRGDRVARGFAWRLAL